MTNQYVVVTSTDPKIQRIISIAFEEFNGETPFETLRQRLLKYVGYSSCLEVLAGEDSKLEKYRQVGLNIYDLKDNLIYKYTSRSKNWLRSKSR